MMKKLRTAVVGAAALLGVGGLAIDPASASVIYTLNVDYCTTGCLSGGTGGTVTVTQADTDQVQVAVALSSVLFHSTNGFTSFVFNLNGISSLTSVTDITDDSATTAFALVSLTAGSIHEDGAGNFMYGLDQTPSPQLSTASTLSFLVTAPGLTEASFAQLSSGGDPSAFFAASVYNTSTTSCTGVIGADGSTTPTLGGSNDGTGTCGGTPPQVPEPATLALFGTALVGLGLIRRRRNRDRAA